MTPKDVSLLKVAVAAAQNRNDELRTELIAALSAGLAPGELLDVLEHAAEHAGHAADRHISILGEALDDADRR